MQKITIFVRNGELLPFLHCNRMDQYEKKEEGWRLIRTRSLPPLQTNSVKELREVMQEVIQMTGDSRIIACAEIAGISFASFDTAGYCIFTIHRISSSVLDGILQDVAARSEEKEMINESIENAFPVETETEGVFYMDLIKLQREYPQISSKKALKNFLEQTPFLELRLDCTHVPTWLEDSGKYRIKSRRKKGMVHAVLTKK